MSGSEFLVAIGRGWNKSPEAVEQGTPRTGVAAALWRETNAGLKEVDTEPDPLQHLVSFQLTSFAAETFYDGKLAFAGQHGNGSFNIVPAGVRPRAIIHGAYSCLQVVLPVELFSNIFPHRDLSKLELVNPKGVVDPAARRIGMELLAELEARQPFARMRLDALGLELAVQILRRWSSLSATSGLARELARGGLAPWQERRCTEYLRDNLAEDVDLATLAAIANLSPFHFARTFKKTTGVPPHRYQLLLRLERAKALLVETDMSVLQVALAVGYDSPPTLARLFQREIGVTPSAYRRGRKL